MDLSSHQRDWEKFKQENTSIALNVLFVSYNSEEIKLAYKSNFNKPKNQIIFLMINDGYNKYSSQWLRGKKETIIGATDFEGALDDTLNYQIIKTNPEKISKLKPCINKYNWKGIDFPPGPKELQKISMK